ncbi:hypothetical protein HOLleu_24541 [Holothuria leucospilota]|uniref:Uncharacterized protein n=1 Tax=Holothuria leucospilota TaxID=206669 RepID=A0A9Q1H6D8_HOLLE|nr:hypothetical protein HOLleu_24541 [Holothuria leucospilota]
MHFNTKKCFSMRITHSRNPKLFNYTLDKDIVESTASHTYLGFQTILPGIDILTISLRLQIGLWRLSEGIYTPVPGVLKLMPTLLLSGLYWSIHLPFGIPTPFPYPIRLSKFNVGLLGLSVMTIPPIVA